MKTINQVLPKGRQSAKNLCSDQRETLQQSANWDQDHANRVAKVWSEMTRTFGSKWDTQWGPMMIDGQATPNYLEWYEETISLTPTQWLCGFDRVGRKISADIAHDRDPWPPTTPAIFVAMCHPPKSEVSATAGQSAASFKNIRDIPEFQARAKEKNMIAADPSYKERKLEKGNSALKDMMDSL